MRRSTVTRLLVAAALAAVVTAPLSGAAQADPLTFAAEEIDVSADRLDVDLERGTAVLDGNVRIAMGELEVNSPKVELRYSTAPRVSWARGSGGVRARVKGIDATAEAVEVDVAARQVRLAGGVRLSRGKGWVKAARASIDLNTRKVTLEGVSGSIPVEAPPR